MRLLPAIIALALPAAAWGQQPNPVAERSMELIRMDFGSMHVQIDQLVAQKEALQKSLGEAQAKLKEMQDKYEPKPKETPGAQQNSQAAPHDGSGSPQPEVRPQDGNPH